jgi:tripartite ATP-independent transporter DctM subunit
MSTGLVLLLLVIGMLILLATGLPCAFSMGGIGLLFLIIFVGPKASLSLFGIVYGTMLEFLLTAIPLYLLMGNLLGASGIAEDLYRAMYMWVGRLPGGLAVGTILICVIFAAMSGMSGPAAVTMGLIALPSMLKRGYDKKMAMGTIMAGGALGILIPPSITMIQFSFMSGTSVGKLYMAGFLPGFLLAGLLICYVLIRCHFQPHMGPPIPADVNFTMKEKMESLKSVIAPLILIILVLGSIYAGVCTVTEAAALGVAGTFVIGLVFRTLTLKTSKEALTHTLILTGMILWIMFGALVFNTVYMQLGLIDQLVRWVLTSKIPPILVLFGMQGILFVMGMFLDPGGIVVVSVPLFVPIVEALGFDLVWFGVLFVMNMEMGYLTPPFGMNLFFM